MAKVRLVNVEKVFDKNVIAVKDFNLEVEDQDFVVLVGPSGCGKSTTLRMIAGLEDITEGEVYIGDRLVNNVPPKDRDIAMVFQNYALYPHMTVYDNMAFGLKLRKYSKKEINTRVQEAAHILDIEELLDRKPKALSGGQRQRVALGRTLVRKPQVFLFDEPLSNLDAKLRIQMRTEIAKLHRKLNTTMIFVTHDQIEAMTMGHHIVVMKDGLIQQVDTPMNLYNHPDNKFVAGFIGSPAMNFLEGDIVQEDGLCFKSNDVSIKIPEELKTHLGKHKDRRVTFGIRCENIVDASLEKELSAYGQFQFNIEVIEPLGNEIYLHLSYGDYTMVMRTEARMQYHLSEPINISFDLKAGHFFDGESEERIY